MFEASHINPIGRGGVMCVQFCESVSTFSINTSIAVSEFDLEMFWSKNVILSHNSLEGRGVYLSLSVSGNL